MQRNQEFSPQQHSIASETENPKDAFMNKIQKAGQASKLSINELFTPVFLNQFTPFTSIEDIFIKAGWQIRSQADFDKISVTTRDTFIQAQTNFPTWQAMVQKALDLWLDRMLDEYHQQK